MRKQFLDQDNATHPFLLGLSALPVWISVCCLLALGSWLCGIIWSSESHSNPPILDDPWIGSTVSITPDDQQFSDVTAEEIVECESISVRLVYGGVMGGFESIDCPSTGKCEYVCRDSRWDSSGWIVLQHPFTPEELRLIRKAIASLGLLHLHKSYSTGIIDGAAKYVRIETPWGVKKIKCQNCYVREVEMFWTLLTTMIQSTRNQDLLNARVVVDEPLRFWLLDLDK